MWNNIDEKIVSVKAYCLSSKYSESKIFGYQSSVKTVGFIEIETESGKKGFGENYASIYAPELLPHIVKFCETLFIGKKIGDKNLIEEIYKIPFIGRNGFIKSIAGSIEIAIWDLRGKLLNKPTFELLGKKREKIKCYASGGSIIMKEGEIQKEVEKLANKGFDSYKMRVGYQAWDNDLKRVKSARKNFSKGNLMVDAIMGTLRPPWNLSEALKKTEDLSEFNLKWIEEPLHPDATEDLLKLKQQSKIPIAAGEAYSGILEYNNLIKNKSVDILQFDCTHSGGIEICKNLSKKCLKNKIETAIHVWGSILALSANIHLSYCLDHISYIEIPVVKLDISDEICTDKPTISDGFVTIQGSPGFGVNITDDVKNKYKMIKNSRFNINK